MSGDWFRQAQFYAVDVRRFLDTDGDGIGDLAGLERRLGYIRALGFDAVWLLPISPSARGDNGYDVTDYLGVDERLGGLSAFGSFVAAAHRHGMRVMVDLVLHHTSDRHPWFVAAELDPESRFRGYYFWRDREPPDDPALSAFPEEEGGVWDYSERADAWYRHFFYRFQPDLDHRSDEVWSEIRRIVDFWIALGADAFRIDALPHFFDEKAGPGSRADLGRRLDELHAFVTARNPEVRLIAEADVPPVEQEPYLAHGVDALYNFMASSALFASLATGSAAPLARVLADQLERQPDHPWVDFVRNVDELDLERLPEDERAAVFRTFAPQPRMRIFGRGIRRAWAPMMRSDREQRMTMSLLFALPGRPLVIAGQELGMGDDLRRSGREAVRLPMQWTAGPSAGFSRRHGAPLAQAVHRRGRFGARRRNALNQLGDAGSLLRFTAKLSRLRREADRAGSGVPAWRIEAAGPLLVLRGPTTVTVHNLSARRVASPQLTGRVLLRDGERPDGAPLPGFGFEWREAAS
ncbi:alpha-amylase family glycosyl hydrolase [Agromyces mediolanus]|uniref:alpha-amylase family glycosyl hydrolase n=1 Tax=Agromyces mediolanus TaxID=41986 RepID=UPI001E4412F9|nr:alpha-amylase family glycosyl hydrolase [Agromyces mediolanus]MCD1570586.1 hypothetical protein [Agromyces mediolanus]